MQIKTTNWSGPEIDFDSIMFVHFGGVKVNKHNEQKVLLSVSKNASKLEIAHFFRKVAKMVCDIESRRVYRNQEKFGHFQFSLANKDYPYFPVKWFTLIFDNGIKIEHDIAFSTTYVYKNGQRVSFAARERKNQKYSRYMELKEKRDAYKFIANQILK